MALGGVEKTEMADNHVWRRAKQQISQVVEGFPLAPVSRQGQCDEDKGGYVGSYIITLYKPWRMTWNHVYHEMRRGFALEPSASGTGF